MLRTFLNGKIRDIRITKTHLEYEGSITLDENYLDEAGILPNEKVQVLDLETGARLTTYTIKGERGSGAVEVNGPAVKLVNKGDRIMVLSYVQLTNDEIPNHKPRIFSAGIA